MTDACLIGHLGPRPACAGVLSRHVRGKRAAKTAWILLNFQSYVKYHIKVLVPAPSAQRPTAHPPIRPRSSVSVSITVRKKHRG